MSVPSAKLCEASLIFGDSKSVQAIAIPEIQPTTQKDRANFVGLVIE